MDLDFFTTEGTEHTEKRNLLPVCELGFRRISRGPSGLSDISLFKTQENSVCSVPSVVRKSGFGASGLTLRIPFDIQNAIFVAKNPGSAKNPSAKPLRLCVSALAFHAHPAASIRSRIRATGIEPKERNSS